MSWFLRSLGDRDTHYGMLGPDQIVTAVCGVRFTPRPLREPLPGHPPDPEQICPACNTRRKDGAQWSTQPEVQVPPSDLDLSRYARRAL
ncbi:MAG: hypothetical protein ACRDR6_01895 [Pseudonocardiaceae bacterium]